MTVVKQLVRRGENQRWRIFDERGCRHPHNAPFRVTDETGAVIAP
jgi:hypothetical protein